MSTVSMWSQLVRGRSTSRRRSAIRNAPNRRNRQVAVIIPWAYRLLKKTGPWTAKNRIGLLENRVQPYSNRISVKGVLDIKFWCPRNHLTYLLIHKIDKEIRKYQRWCYGLSSDVHCSDWINWTQDWDKSWAVSSQSLVSAKDLSRKWNDLT